MRTSEFTQPLGKNTALNPPKLYLKANQPAGVRGAPQTSKLLRSIAKIANFDAVGFRGVAVTWW